MVTINQLVKVMRIRKKKICNVRVLKKNPQKKGICRKIRIVKPKKPNSAQRKIVKVNLWLRRDALAYIPGQGHNLKNFFSVLVSGGRANDLPGVRLSLIRGKYDFSWNESFRRINKGSKYGIPKSERYSNIEYEDDNNED